jgi:hypothetical protein
MTTAKRNRKIKNVLGKEYGADKVWVRGSRGTAYGWVSVYIDVPKPYPQIDDQGYITSEARDYAEKIRSRVWQLFRANGIEIGTYGYDDPGSDYGYGSKIHINLQRPYGV